MKEQLKVATWNIGGAHTVNSNSMFDYDKEDLSYFIDILKATRPDIVCLQESHTKKNRVLAELIAKELELSYVFDSPRSPSHIDEDYELANAIISRYPIENPRQIFLPDPPFELYLEGGKKVARLFHTYVQIAQIHGMTIANTHLQPLHLFGYSWGEGRGNILAGKTEDVFLKNLEVPLLFSGDFNAPHLQEDFSRFMKKFDLTPALHNEATDIKGNKMDYILYSPEFSLAKAELVKTEKSDHYLGLATFIRAIE
jgi:endonuclease/exonuclease/phosphatase family metal-dependent hydrolase